MWLLMNIGCIECGVDSAVVGVFSDENRALELAKWLSGLNQFSWRQGGQNYYEVYELPEIDVVADEYKIDGDYETANKTQTQS